MQETVATASLAKLDYNLSVSRLKRRSGKKKKKRRPRYRDIGSFFHLRAPGRKNRGIPGGRKKKKRGKKLRFAATCKARWTGKGEKEGTNPMNRSCRIGHDGRKKGIKKKEKKGEEGDSLIGPVDPITLAASCRKDTNPYGYGVGDIPRRELNS